MTILLNEITTYDEFINLQGPWNAVLKKSNNDCIFLTWEWLKTWWDVFGHDKELRVVVGYLSDNSLAGIAPMMVRKEAIAGVTFRCMEFIGSGNEITPDNLGFICIPGHKKEFLDAFFAYTAGNTNWDMLRLKDMREGTMADSDVTVLKKNKYSYHVEENGICPYIALPGSWDEYLNMLSSANRYNIGRKERSISKAYKTEFTLWDNRASLSDILTALETLHRQRMSDKMMESASTDYNFWEFHRRIINEFFSKGCVLLGVLKAGDKITACQYAFRYNNKVLFYQSGFDPDFRKFSVGLLSTAYMIKEAIKIGATEYDFLRGSEGYKFHWAKTYRNNTEMILWNRNIKGGLSKVMWRSKRYIKGIINNDRD